MGDEFWPLPGRIFAAARSHTFAQLGCVAGSRKAEQALPDRITSSRVFKIGRRTNARSAAWQDRQAFGDPRA
jgi:hypothetical protein